MKRTKTITAQDKQTKVTVIVKVQTIKMRSSADYMVDGIASGVMTTLASSLGLSVPLSRIKVK